MAVQEHASAKLIEAARRATEGSEQRDTAPRKVRLSWFLDRVLPIAACLVVMDLAWLVLRRQDLIDDAYITARYAANLAHGYGWTWNTGGPATDGTTAPLWTLLLAAVLLLHLPLVSMTIALNVMSYGLCALSACLLVHALAGRVGAAPGPAPSTRRFPGRPRP